MAKQELEFEATFFSNNSPESKEAEDLLKKAGIIYQKWVEGVNYGNGGEDPIIPPELMARYGDFRGIQGIESYIALKESDPGNPKNQ